MRILSKAVFLLFVILVLFSCQPSVNQTDADVAAIQALIQAWVTAIETGDLAGYMALYTDDIVQLPDGAPVNKGKQALEDHCRSLLDQFTFEVTWPVEGTEEIIVSDGWAFHLSEFIEKLTPKAGGETIEMYGKIIEVCQKQPDGSWKFAREIWNLNSK